MNSKEDRRQPIPPDQQGQSNPEKFQHPKPRLEGRLSMEVVGKYHIFLTDDCDPRFAEYLRGLQTEEEVSSFISEGLQRVYTKSRRKIYQPKSATIPGLAGVLAIFKQKELLASSEVFPDLDVSGFTTDVFHEMETTYALQDIFERRADDLPKTVEFDGAQYQITYQIQKPWGALVDTQNESEKYGIFEYIHGQSFRDELTQYQYWNSVPQVLREFNGKLQTDVFQKIADMCVLEEGLEPWDFGTNQMVYTLDKETKQLKIGIIDTEEYNFVSDGSFWPESFLNGGLPSVLFWKLAFRFTYDPDFDD